MKTKSILNKLIYGNKVVVICTLFTLTTILDAVLSSMAGVYIIDYQHIFQRLLLCTLIVLSFYIFKLFSKLPIFVMLIIHCIIAIGIMLLAVWISSFFMEINQHAYCDAARTILYIYPVIIVICVVVDLIRTARANKMLKEANRHI